MKRGNGLDLPKIHYQRSTKHIPGSLELAYLGDVVFELYVRSALVAQGGRMKQLHKQAIGKVCAHAQAQSLKLIESDLSEEERAVVRRARNAKQNPPRNADPAEYHTATGLEALVGFLYYYGRSDRLDEVMNRLMVVDGEEGEDICRK